MRTVYQLLRDEGLFLGSTSGVNVAAALQIAKRLGPGHTIVTILCDNGAKYQSRLFNRKWLAEKGLLEAAGLDQPLAPDLVPPVPFTQFRSRRLLVSMHTDSALKFERHPIHTDVVIVGAGPCGLFQVFELGLLGLKAHVVDSLKAPGGQCVELYPDKPIYDIPAVPVCTGQELTDRLLEQIRPFGAGLHLGQEVTEVERQENGRFRVATSAGTVFDAGAVVIAGGVGSFQPRKLDVPGAAELEGKYIHYRVQGSARLRGSGRRDPRRRRLRARLGADARRARAQRRARASAAGVPRRARIGREALRAAR